MKKKINMVELSKDFERLVKELPEHEDKLRDICYRFRMWGREDEKSGLSRIVDKIKCGSRRKPA